MVHFWWFLPWLLTLLDPPGPKSGHADQMTSYNEDELYGIYDIAECYSMRGEGSELAMQFRGGDIPDQATIGTPPKVHGKGHEAPLGACPPAASKRSFKRALRRAQTYGWTTYKGQILSQKVIDPMPSMVNKVPPPQPTSRTGRRATILTWNAGGLTTELYHELMQWGQSNQIDIMMVQSTRWREDKTWSAYGYSAVHTGESWDNKTTFAGLLTCVSNRLCHFDNISYASPIQGRLQHVKCRLHSKSIDIINVYQYTEKVTAQVKVPMQARTTLLSQLDHLLGRIAYRNILVVGGDFNCPLDQSAFAGLLKKFMLHSSRTHDKGPTYIGPTGSSTIDFLLFRKAQMDSLAHHGRSLKDFPLASWREVPDHMPIVSSLPLSWTCWFAKPHSAIRLSRTTKAHLWTAWKDQTPARQRLHSTLVQQVGQLPASLDSSKPMQSKLAISSFGQPHSPQSPRTGLSLPAYGATSKPFVEFNV